jgi:hypothetical protein
MISAIVSISSSRTASGRFGHLHDKRYTPSNVLKRDDFTIFELQSMENAHKALVNHPDLVSLFQPIAGNLTSATRVVLALMQGKVPDSGTSLMKELELTMLEITTATHQIQGYSDNGSNTNHRIREINFSQMVYVRKLIEIVVLLGFDWSCFKHLIPLLLCMESCEAARVPLNAVRLVVSIHSPTKVKHYLIGYVPMSTSPMDMYVFTYHDKRY